MYKLGQKVWVVGMGLNPVRGVIVEIDNSKYGVREGADTPKEGNGCIIHSGLKENQIYPDKIGAVWEILGYWMDYSKDLQSVLKECEKIHDPDKIMEKIKDLGS